MSKTKKTVWLSLPKYVVPADYEKWLEEMAADGWNLKIKGGFNSLWVVFYKSEPKKYRYVYDLQAAPRGDYVKTYEDFGWELTGRAASVYIWRREYEGERPDAFTDEKSLEQRSKRVIMGMSFSFFTFLLMFLSFLVLGIVALVQNKSVDVIAQYITVVVLSGLLAFYMGVIMRKIYKRRNK